MAVVLPFCPFVESGPAWNQDDPDEELPVRSSRWEHCVQDLVDKVTQERHSLAGGLTDTSRQVFTPLGFQVRSFSRVPYLCSGLAADEPVLQLDDSVFVLVPTAEII